MTAVDKYFEIKGKSTIFIGDTLEIFISSRFENHGFLEIGNTVKTIGIFDLLINGSIEAGYLLAAMIEIIPSDVSTINIGGEKIVKLDLVKGDIFINENAIVKDSKISYVVFYETFLSGHYPKFLKYKDCGTLFDEVSRATGDQFSTDHMNFEMMASVLFRDPSNISNEYRQTDFSKDPTVLPLRMISHISKSTTGKMVGSYMRDGLDATLVNASDTPSDIENLLRK